ncbi:glycosyltransferase family 4 protein [Methanolobus sp.]|uniref:glycosyltransferase family 4 protein n=1 Tax=Methanolobus sp. TaxID=1874737 RepID=UPI0025DA9578|nr:glycosyltransferase family 4 protein [Methanolobus sp.]
MKICLIADAVSIHTQRWAQYFVQQGDEVHLISYEPSKLDYSGVNVHVIGSWFKNLYLSFFPRHIKIYFLIRRLKPDIVHAHFISKFGFHVAALGFSPVIMSAWGTDILVIPYHSRLLWHFTKLSLKSSNMVFGVSDDISRKIISEFGVSPEIVKTVPFGVDTRLFHSLDKSNTDSEGKITVLSNRNFLEVYDLANLINAIPLVIARNKDIHFIIKGSGPLEKDLKELVGKLGIGEHVTFIGWLEYEQMPELLHQSDIYVSTAISDGSPVSVLEAMACGKACIVTDVGGVSEWVKDGVSGYLIPPCDPQILASKILELADNLDIRTNLGKNALSVIELKGDWYHIMEDVRKQYVELVGK